MRVRAVVCCAVLLTGCGEAFSSRVEVVARAGDHELDVRRLTEILATGKGLPIQREVVEGLAMMWVNYSLLAQALVAGDSLLDSATVVAAKWPDVQQDIASGYHAMLVGDATTLDSVQVDSAYAAGDLRLIKHVLFAVRPDDPAEIRNAKRGVAGGVRLQLVGGLAWAEAAQNTEEPGGAERGGSLGVIGRGEMVTAFENAAYELAPGQTSGVVETSYGYHILYRPALAEVREEFRGGVEQRLEAQFDENYLSAIPERWDIEVRTGALPAAREVANNPVRAKRSRTVVGTYRGGEFRVADFARWLQAMPPQVRGQLATASDSQVTQMIRSLIRNEVLLHEARESGIETPAEVVEELREDLRRELALLGAAMGFPSDSLGVVRATAPEERFTAVRIRVLDYLERLSQNRGRLQLVPPFLADELQERFAWEIVPAGVEQTLSRARTMRASLDSADTQAAPAPPPVTPPAADSGAQGDTP